MALIKRADVDRVTRDACVLDLGDMERRGELLRTAAREEAARVLADAQAERERLVEGARRDGYASGLAAGRAEGIAQGAEIGRQEAAREHAAAIEKLLASWSNALAWFEQERERMLLEARQDVLELALVLAERVTRRTIELDREVASAQLEDVLRAVARPTGLEIAVHPMDLVLVERTLGSLSSELEAAAHARVVVDNAMERGSCIARCAGGARVDASIRTQLERALEAVLPGAGAIAREAPGAPAERAIETERDAGEDRGTRGAAA